jgi:hypothetical protein
MKHDMTMGMRADRDAMAGADDLAHAIADDGMGPHEETLLWMAKAAARAGVSPTLLAAMLDQSAAQVVRQRAFGAVMRAMENRPSPAEAVALSAGAVSRQQLGGAAA